MKTFKAAPGAKRLIESLRSMGYECSTAIADLVDNSISAGATEVRINIQARKGLRPAFVSVIDNGSGMNERALIEAMRFGAYQEYSKQDLGKYGLGLKTASLSQCRVLTVVSRCGRSKPASTVRWDLDYVHKSDEWDLLSLDSEDLKDWEAELLDAGQIKSSGTIVLWSGVTESLPLLEAEDVKQKSKFLGALLEEVSSHLRMVFHRFLQGQVPNRKKVAIYIGETSLTAWDPFCVAEAATKALAISKLQVELREENGKRRRVPETRSVTIRPVILPREDQFSSPVAWRDATGPNGWNQQQGLYFYRNHRLIKAGGWSYLRSLDEHTKLLRIAIDFGSDLDQAFAINITKMRALLPAEIKEPLRSQLTDWIRLAKERYSGGKGSAIVRSKPVDDSVKRARASGFNLGSINFSLSNSPSPYVTVVRGSKPGQIKLIIPHKHDCAALFDRLMSEDEDQSADLRKLCMTMFGMIEVMTQKRMVPSDVPLDMLRREVLRHL